MKNTTTDKNPNTYHVALLRGINVGGHHKVPMKELVSLLRNLDFQEIKTYLNSGNILFKAPKSDERTLETFLSAEFTKFFGFPIPVFIISFETLKSLTQNNVFQNIEVTNDTRLYVSFLREQPKNEKLIKEQTEDQGFRIVAIKENAIFSVLDLSQIQSTKAMEKLDACFAKNITTRNLNTLNKIVETFRF